MKKQNGITIISLVVTIIILIILAGVSINLILGENGIITIAKQAKENTELAKIEEEIRLNELYDELKNENSSGISYDAIAKLVEFKKEIASAISDMGIATSEDADVSTMASNIRSISGASSADKVSYDNTNSGLSATNVQGAIDEVNNSLIKIKKLTYTVTLEANPSGLGGYIGTTSLSSNEDLPDNIVGYSIEYCYFSINQNFLGTASIYNNDELKVNGARAGTYTVELLCFYV